ncbi:MAG: hypothetical protein QOF52_104 [Propionibacteriaceae bacterium]|nr:hypothetical protein [Propionibacteriaceae bacterium]
MNFLRKLFGSRDDDGADLPINLDVPARQEQLARLELALDALASAMREAQSVDNPGWRARVNEYSRLAGEAMVQRRGTPTREGLLDLAFEIRPVFVGPVPAGLEDLVPLQDKVMALSAELSAVLPGER